MKEDKELFKGDAKFMVDNLFDKDFFNESMTRDAMNVFEDVIAETMYLRWKSHVQSQELIKKIKLSTKEYIIQPSKDSKD